MIKYQIKTGSKFLNEKARGERDLVFKPRLKRMNCKKCKTDTIIEFVEEDYNYVKSIIHSCCFHFNSRIREKLWPSKK